jgi:hypothetical protein
LSVPPFVWFDLLDAWGEGRNMHWRRKRNRSWQSGRDQTMELSLWQRQRIV